MSHLDEMKTQFKNTEAMVRGLMRTLGLQRNQIEVHAKAVDIIGYHGTDDHKVGNVIIRKQHTGIPSDIGWEMKDGVLVGHIDTFQYGGRKMTYDAKFNLKLTENYNFELSKMTFEARGIQVTECRDKQNRLQLRAKMIKNAVKAKVRL